MYDESHGLSRRLTKIELEIKALKKATDTLISDSEKTMSTSLPRDYHVDADGNVVPLPNTGSPLISPNQMSHAKDMELQSQVYDGLSTWQAEHTRLKSRLREVDNASLRLDEARRKHYKGAQKELKENVMKQDNVSAGQTRELDNPQLISAREAFLKIEGEVHAELARHAENARQIQQYITKAMELQGERLIEASRVHARPFSGGVGATGTGMGAGTGMGTGAGMAQLGGHIGEMHQGPVAGGGMPGASPAGTAVQM
jgi:hypothetical protein